ncbi:MAG: hypothetical protein AB1442_05710 [Nitrospirota bacterium]
MKCPHCGKESTDRETCTNCGKEIHVPAEDVEVEYKEFTLSEFLEIRKKKEQAEKDKAGVQASRRTAPSVDRQESGARATPDKYVLIVVAIVGILAGLIGIFFLLKFFFE